jgi:hypothetical protein
MTHKKKIDLFVVWSDLYLESVDIARLRRRQKNDMQKAYIEPQTLEESGYYFESKLDENYF